MMYYEQLLLYTPEFTRERYMGNARTVLEEGQNSNQGDLCFTLKQIRQMGRINENVEIWEKENRWRRVCETVK